MVEELFDVNEIQPELEEVKSSRKSFKLIKEPKWEPSELDSDSDLQYRLVKIFNYYNEESDSKDVKKWLLYYVKHTLKNNSLYESISSVSDNSLSSSAGYIARLINNGAIGLPNKLYDHLNKTIESANILGTKQKNDLQQRIDRMQSARKAHSRDVSLEKAVTNLDKMIDNLCDGSKTDLITLTFFKDELNKNNTELIINTYQPMLDEISLALAGDADLSFAYSSYSKTVLKNLLEFLSSIITSAEEWAADKGSDSVISKTKKPRKPRLRKHKTPSEQVKKLQYLPTYPELGVRSIPPSKIIGSQVLWVYNIKYRYLGCYKATDTIGFSVKGSTIKNFDMESSTEKKLRKPKDYLETALTGNKVTLRKLLDNIKTKEKKLTGRINKDTIILRAF